MRPRVDRFEQAAVGQQHARALERSVSQRLDDLRGPGRQHADGRGLVRVDTGAERAGNADPGDVFERDAHGADSTSRSVNMAALDFMKFWISRLPDKERFGRAAGDLIARLARR